ncbi:MAG: hypothetical protein KME09_26435 [Pleurocapsa minor HA4230-MV1]|jgi:hypothetical protein|nr:hypothetical protein [Pleurocapsa minor HA4230-MV1]
MKKIFKLLGLFLCVICLIILARIFQNLIYSASSVTCLESKPEDTYNFGQALALNDNYIAVGDPEANRVAIYSYDKSQDKWSRIREVYPAKNSIIDKVGAGFGKYLVFNQNQLIIGAFSDFVPSHFDEDTQDKLRNRGFVYSLQVNEGNQNALMEINLPEGINPTGYAVKVFNNKIALGTTVVNDYENKPDKVLIVNPITLKVESVIEPSILPSKQENFGIGITGNSNYLVISAPNISTQGGVYLIDKYGELKTISMSEISTSSADKTRKFSSPIALGDDFLAIYSGGWDALLSIFKQSSKGWKEIYSIYLLGSLSTDKSLLLVSTSRYPMDGGLIKRWPNHLLIDVRENKAFTKSIIRWHWWYYVGSAEAQGVINSKYLLLSRNGKVVLLKKNFIPNYYVINRSFCKEK